MTAAGPSGDIAFLLGAGVSARYGVPAMLGFYEELMEYLKRRYPDAVDLARTLTSATQDADLEILIENVEKAVAAAEGLPLLPSADTDAVKGDLQRIRALRSYIRAFIVDRCERFNTTRAAGELLPLFQLSTKMTVTIFTTNYDRIIEHCAQETEFPCSDGFVGGSEPVATWARKFDGSLRLVKLHGSVNWFHHGDAVVRLDRGFPLPSHEFQLNWAGRTLTSLMVVPTLQKETLEPPYSELRVLFGDVILASRLLIIAGSSLRDAHLTSVIATRLQDDQAVVLIIDPAIPAGIDALVRRDLVVHATGEFHAFLSVATDALPALAREIAAASDIAEAYRRLREFAQTVQTKMQSLAALTEEGKRAVRALTHGSPAEKIAAVRNLRGNSSEVVVNALLAGLADEDPEVRAAAASVVAQLDEPRAVPLLEANIANSRDSRQKMEAVLALKRMTVPEATLAIERIKQSQAGADPLVKRVLS